jgi:hypothetical protein
LIGIINQKLNIIDVHQFSCTLNISLFSTKALHNSSPRKKHQPLLIYLIFNRKRFYDFTYQSLSVDFDLNSFSLFIRTCAESEVEVSFHFILREECFDFPFRIVFKLFITKSFGVLLKFLPFFKSYRLSSNFYMSFLLSALLIVCFVCLSDFNSLFSFFFFLIKV